MNGLLTELGKRLADRWLTGILLPGALFGVLLWAAATLGWCHALDHNRLIDAAGRAGEALGARPGALGQATMLVPAAAALGITARGAGAVLHHVWLSPWPRWTHWLQRPLVAWRRKRADTTIPGYRPKSPTWMAERMRLLDARIDAGYGLRIGLLWPRLWVLLDEHQRRPVETARNDLVHAATMSAWGLGTVAVTPLWWPAAPLGLVLFGAGIRRGRVASTNLADLIESLVDTSLPKIADLFGVPLRGGTISRDDGRQITDRLNKGA